MKKYFVPILGILILVGGMFPDGLSAQLQPLVVVSLALDKTIYKSSPPEPIHAVLSLSNITGGGLITPQGFQDQPFHLYLVFTDPTGKTITSPLLRDTSPLDPPPPTVLTDDSGNMVQVEPVETLSSTWQKSLTFKVQDYYILPPTGIYKVKALISLRTYPQIDFPATPDNPTDWSRLDSRNWEGHVESNTLSFTLGEPVVTRLEVSPPLATIISGQTQAYTIQAFDTNNKTMGDMTGLTNFSISPDGSCTGNICTASAGGPHTVTASNAGKIATAGLQVNYNSIQISPPTATIISGGSQAYAVQAFGVNNTKPGGCDWVNDLFHFPRRQLRRQHLFGFCGGTSHRYSIECWKNSDRRTSSQL